MRISPNRSKKFAPVVERKLSKNPYGRGEPIWGLCDSFYSGGVQIDPRLRDFDYLDTMIHELLHREFFFLREEIVNSVATIIAKELWKRQYRSHRTMKKI